MENLEAGKLADLRVVFSLRSIKGVDVVDDSLDAPLIRVVNRRGSFVSVLGTAPVEVVMEFSRFVRLAAFDARFTQGPPETLRQVRWIRLWIAR